MVSEKQRIVAKKNIKKAQVKWKSMTSRQHSLAQPEGRKRAKPGTAGKGNFYRITVRPKSQFTFFRNQDVGGKGHIERIAGKRKSGSWATQAWLIEKTDAKVKGNILIGITPEAKDLIRSLSSKPKLEKGDVFSAKPKRNVPEKEKPTSAMKTAQKKNIKKAQEAKWKI